MPLKNKPPITAFITRKDNNRNGLEITEIEFLLSQDRLILQENMGFFLFCEPLCRTCKFNVSTSVYTAPS